MPAIVVSILPLVLLAALIGYLGSDRKFGFWGNFFVSLLLTPIIGLLVFFAQSPKTKPSA
ncbi:MAG: hypothetical protein EXS41_00895 [Opitutaceae bacterium]|nr:hypothetical protein [Opitutaceae bacterium]